jgi:site-specific recombinase XerD
MFQNKNNEKLSRHTAYRLMKKIQKRFNLEDLGTHTLRKTFGFHFYDRTNDIATLMIIFNHSSEAITLKYLGIQQDLIDKKMKKFGGF